MGKTKKIRRKNKQIKLKNKKLCKRYPFLIPKDRIRNQKYDYSWTKYDWIEDGWRIGFGRFLLEDLREALVETNYLHKLEILEIKEKWGMLRIYTNAVPKQVMNVLDKYECISEYVCIECGNPNATATINHGYILPICKDCWDSYNKRLKEDGYSVTSYEEAIDPDGMLRLPEKYSYAVYCDDTKEVITIGMSDTVNKIYEAYKRRVRKANKRIGKGGKK